MESCSCMSPAASPLARRDIIEIVRSASVAGLYVNLITAAVNLTPERADALVAAGVDHVQISLQDATREGVALVAKSEGAFEKKLAAARLVTERGLPLTVNAVVHRQNLDRVERIIEIAEALGAHRLEIAHTQYYGWAYINRSTLMPERRQVEAATRCVSEAQERLRGRMLIDYVVPDYFAKYPKPCMGGWGRQFINVTPSGTVMPCHAAASIPGLHSPMSASAISTGSGTNRRPSIAFAGRLRCPNPVAAVHGRRRISAAAAARHSC